MLGVRLVVSRSVANAYALKSSLKLVFPLAKARSLAISKKRRDVELGGVARQRGTLWEVGQWVEAGISARRGGRGLGLAAYLWALEVNYKS